MWIEEANQMLNRIIIQLGVKTKEKKNNILLNGNLPQDVSSTNLSAPTSSKDTRSVSAPSTEKFQTDTAWQYWTAIVVGVFDSQVFPWELRLVHLQSLLQLDASLLLEGVALPVLVFAWVVSFSQHHRIKLNPCCCCFGVKVVIEKKYNCVKL